MLLIGIFGEKYEHSYKHSQLYWKSVQQDQKLICIITCESKLFQKDNINAMV